MQTMNTDQQPYYPNQTGSAGYYQQNGPEPQYSIRNPNMYAQQMHVNPPYYTTNNYGAQGYYLPQFVSGAQFAPNNPRPMNPSGIAIIRQPNETQIGSQYPTYPPQPQTIYSHAQYNPYQGQPFPPPTQQPQYHSQQLTQSPQTSQQSLHDQQHVQSSQPTIEKRQRKPLAIVDPTSHEAIQVVTPNSSTNTTATEESTDAKKSKIQADFRHDFAGILNRNIQPDKDTNQSSTKENQNNENLQASTSSSRSSSISKTSSEQSQLVVVPEIATEKKSNEEQIPTEPEITDSKSSSDETSYEMINEISSPEVIENITSEKANDTEPEPEPATLGKTSSGSKRFGYTIEELRKKQTSVLSKERPSQLKEIPGVTLLAPPPPPVKTEIDADEKFVRDVTAILNKLTPQNYDKLVQKLDKLELNSAKRLEAMISVMFLKAVEAAIFCSLYAKLCKHFQRKQVTVPNEAGQENTFFFRQILLTRCQKEFEGDYRQNIRYEERHVEVEAIADEKVRREAAELLEEDLLKAKRKKLGNIIFIGELFKLQMLTDTIMYDCVDYLLRDKTDEESLECLCKLLTNIGKELDAKASEKAANRKSLDKNYVDLENITTLRQTSARIRFMIQDLFDMKRAGWVSRRAELKPTTIDEIHEAARLKREQEEFDRDRERQQRRDHPRMGGGGGPQQYTGSRGSRGSGVKQQSNRADDDRADSRVIASLKHQLNEKKNQDGPQLNFAPPRAWGKGSGVEKKSEDDRSNAGRTNKPPAGATTPIRSKPGAPSGTPGYPTQRQPSRELARENSFRDRENAKDSLRKATSVTGPNNTASRESSRNVSPEPTKIPTTDNNPNAPFDEEKTQTHVHSLIEEYTENYSDNTDRPVNEAIEDLTSFCTANPNQQAVVVRELFTNVLEAKPRARKAVGHLLDVALHKNVFSSEGFLSGVKMFIEVVPDYAVDIPLIWQYIAEILGAFIGAPSSNMNLLKPVLELIPETKSKQLFKDVIRFAVEFSSKAQVQKFWQLAGFTLNDLVKADSSFTDEYSWLTEQTESETTTTTTTDNQLPDADPQLVTLFKSISDPGKSVTDDQIIAYIQKNMNPTDKYYIHNIVLSYLEACLVNREPQKKNMKIQENIAKERMTVLNKIIEKRPEAELQAVYAIQNFVHKLEHPSKMARLLFDIFYDEECISEETFFEWLGHPDQSQIDGHSVVVISTKDFFTWLQQAEPEGEGEGEEEEEKGEGGES